MLIVFDVQVAPKPSAMPQEKASFPSEFLIHFVPLVYVLVTILKNLFESANCEVASVNLMSV